MLSGSLWLAHPEFLEHPRPQAQAALPLWDGSSHINRCLRKCPTDNPTGKFGRTVFSVEAPSSKVTLHHVKLT